MLSLDNWLSGFDCLSKEIADKPTFLRGLFVHLLV